MNIKILSVVGARPNFMKIAAICEAVRVSNQQSNSVWLQHVLVHTGQHYDAAMSDSFFNDLELPKPDIFLGVGSASHSIQTARIMEKFEQVLLSEAPDIVLVVGDVNSTAACALVTKKTEVTNAQRGTFIPTLVHVEAGLRSFDRTMPEEINRIVTDSISDWLFTTEESANRNLLRESILEENIFFVGNVMIDTLMRHRRRADESSILSDLQLLENSSVRQYGVLTLHRPSNVDDVAVLSKMLESFLVVGQKAQLIFPVHPRTQKRIEDGELGDYFVDHFISKPEPWDKRVRIRMVPPLGYLDFLKLVGNARIVLTDSGGVQEETTILGVPCLTLRDNTERPVTVEYGTNVLVGRDPKKIIDVCTSVLANNCKVTKSPPLWDGAAAERILKILIAEYSTRVYRSASNG